MKNLAIPRANKEQREWHIDEVNSSPIPIFLPSPVFRASIMKSRLGNRCGVGPSRPNIGLETAEIARTVAAVSRRENDVVLNATRAAAEEEMCRRMCQLADETMEGYKKKNSETESLASEYLMANYELENNFIDVYKDVKIRCLASETQRCSQGGTIQGGHKPSQGMDTRPGFDFSKALRSSLDKTEKGSARSTVQSRGAYAPDEVDEEHNYANLMKRLVLDDPHKKKIKWRPSKCLTRYTSPYPMPELPEPVPKVGQSILPDAEEIELVPKQRELWCGCCMRTCFDPYFLPCGHNFCRRCIQEMNYFLLKDHAKVVEDARTLLKCPLRHCHALIQCLPLLNGDFRFHLVRPEDKVQEKKDPILNPCDQHRLTHYVIKLDLDLVRRKSDNLFDGYDDIVAKPSLQKLSCTHY